MKNQRKPITNIIDTVPFVAIDDKGMISLGQGRYSKSYRLSDINYLTAKDHEQQDTYDGWCKVLNGFEAGTFIQVTINNKNLDMSSYESETMIPETGDKYDRYRRSYNSIVKDKILEGKNTIKRDKYITISIPSKDSVSATQTFLRMDQELQDAVKNIPGSGVSTIVPTERIQILHDLYNVGREDEFLLKNSQHSIRHIIEQGLTVKELIIPESANFSNSSFRLGEKICTVLYMSHFAASINDSFFAELSSIDKNVLISLNALCMDQAEAIHMVRNQMTNISAEVIAAQKNASRDGYDMSLISPTLLELQTEAKLLHNDLSNRNQKLYKVQLLITVFADSRDELNDSVAAIKTIGNRHSCIFSQYRGFQEDAFNSCLPLGLNLVTEYRTLTTEALAVFIPFASQELNQKNGMYYGLNTVSRNLIKYNRLSGSNYNALIFGQPGSGKSFFGKREILNTFINPSINPDIIIIDPEDEYGSLGKLLGAEIINIESDSIHHVNPFDLDRSYVDESKNPIPGKIEFLLSMFELILGTYSGLTPGQTSLIDKCARITYQKMYENDFDSIYTPTMKDFYNNMVGLFQVNQDPEAYDLAKAMEIYVDGSLNTFSYKTNVNTKNNFVVYNIKNMSDAQKPLACLIITDFIWNRICRNRKLGKPTFLYIDEAHLLFQSPQTAAFISTLYKRARKYNGAITSITQNTSDILGSPHVGTIIENTSFVAMLSLSYKSAAELAQILDIGKTQMDFTKNVAPGSGLLYLQSAPGLPTSIIPFTDNFPTDNELYKAFNTRNLSY